MCICFGALAISKSFACLGLIRGGLGSQTGSGKNIKEALLIMAAKRVKRAERVTGVDDSMIFASKNRH